MSSKLVSGDHPGDRRTDKKELRQQVRTGKRQVLGPVPAMLAWIVHAWLHPPSQEAHWEQ